MSYDICLTVDTGGEEPARIVGAEHWNMTSNVSDMWRAAGVDLAEFQGRTAKDCLVELEHAITEMYADPDQFKQWEPSNGWGSVASCRWGLVSLRNMFKKHPNAIVQVSR